MTRSTPTPVVLDANVFVSAAIQRGSSYRLVESLVDLVDDPGGTRSETRDPTDDYIIALARENDAVLIVSGDKDLLEWEKQEPPVMTPSQFEEHLRTI